MDIEQILLKLPLPAKPVCDQTLDPVIESAGGTSADLALPFGDFLFNASAEGSFALKLFNDKNDHGEEKKIFDEWPEAASMYTENALLCYGLQGKIKAEVSGKALEKFELGLDADQSFEIKSFRIHPCETKVNEAVASDITSFKFIFSKQHVKDLKVNEALSFEAAGSLSLKASVKVSDVFTGSASAISSLLNLNGKVNIKLDASASLNVNVSIEDDFKVLIIRVGEDNYRVSINKIIKRTNELKAKAGITAGIENDEDLEKLVDQFLIGIDERVFEPVVEKIESTGLNDSHLDLVKKALDLLGVDVDIPNITEAKAKYEEYRNKVKEKILESVTTKVSVGVAYEYRRIKTNESLFKAELSASAMDTFHQNIVRLQVDKLTDAYLADTSVFELKEYMKREILDVDSSFGINFAFGNFKLTNTVKNEFDQVKEYKIFDDDQKKVKVSTYGRKTTRTVKVGKNEDEFLINFDADMRGFVENENQLTADQFDFEFDTSVEMLERKTDDVELSNVVDWAVTWDIIDPEKFEEVHQQLDELRSKFENIRYKFYLRLAESTALDGSVNADLFNDIIGDVPGLHNLKIASALAAALPYADFQGHDDFEARRNIHQRRMVYTSFWMSYLENDGFDQAASDPKKYSERIGKLLSDSLSGRELNELAKFEDDNSEQYPKIGRLSVEQLLTGNIMMNRLERFRRGTSFLMDGINNKKGYVKTFKKSYANIKSVGLTEYNLRFLGRLFLDIAEDNNIKDEVSRGFTVTYEEGGEEKMIVFA